MNDLLALIALGLILHLALKLIIIMKLSDLASTLTAVNAKLDSAIASKADPELPADAASQIVALQSKADTLAGTPAANPS